MQIATEATAYNPFLTEVPVIKTNLGSKVLWMNPAAERLLGFDKTEVVGRNLFEFFVANGLPRATDGVAVVTGQISPRSGQPLRCELAAWSATTDTGDIEVQNLVHL